MLRNIARALPRQASRKVPALTIRAISTTSLRSMPAGLPAVDPPVSSALPSDLYHLLSTAQKAGSAEDALFQQQVQDVKQWWASPRYEGIKRPYSAEDVVSKRGSLQQTYPSSLMARKLFNLFKERGAKGEPVHTSLSPWKEQVWIYGLTFLQWASSTLCR